MSDVWSRCCGVLARYGGRLALVVLLVAPVAAPAGATTSRALLIGINEYASPQVPNLRGAVNDVNKMARILETRFEFPSENIQVLTDAEATRAAIIAALEALVDAAGPADVVYVHFSGHGSRVEDLNGDEEDGMDETILPYDARLPDVPDIVDDELDLIFSRLRAANALLVFDSCHSGTVTRSAALRSLAGSNDRPETLSPVQVRAVAPDHRLSLYAPLAVRTRSVRPLNQLTHVLLSSAPAEQEAFDGPVGGTFYGLFSYALGRSMEALGPGASALELHDRARAELQDVQSSLNVIAPEPQLEGPPAKLEAPPLAGSTAASVTAPQVAGGGFAQAWLDASLLTDGMVLLLDGAALGAQPGSQWALYGEGESEFAFGRALAAGTVQSLRDRDAVLSLQQQSGAIPQRARAVRLTSPDVWASIPVRMLVSDGGRAARLLSLIQQAMPEVTLAEAGDHPRFLIELREGRWTLWDAGGLTRLIEFPDTGDVAVAERVQTSLASASSALAVLALDNPASDIDLRVAIIDADLVADARAAVRGVLVRPAGARPPTYRFRRDGEPRSAANSLMLEVYVDRPGYLTVVHVDPLGSSALLFPNPFQSEDFFAQGYVAEPARVRIPDSFADVNVAGFHWDYGPPAGRDTLRVFFSEDLDTAMALRGSVAAQPRAALAPVRALSQQLSERLVRGVVLRPATAPGAGLGPNPPEPARHPGGWTVRTVVVDVEP